MKKNVAIKFQLKIKTTEEKKNNPTKQKYSFEKNKGNQEAENKKEMFTFF